jgi:hypothetical protein
MDQIFDLFGDPVPANWGQRGRPGHIPTQQNRNRVSMLVALGWSNPRIASALLVTVPTLRKHYFSELKYRDVARDRLEAGIAMKLWEGVQAGRVPAIKEFRAFIERNDRMEIERTMGSESKDASDSARPNRPGKKLVDKQRAIDADADLMAELEEEAAQNAAVH